MRNVNALRNHDAPSILDKRGALNTLVVWVVLMAGSAFAQQNASGAVVGLNPDAPPAESSSRQQQPANVLPNAPSATSRPYSSANSLTFGDRFHIYRQTILRPYSLVGPALGAGIGQWENEPPEWGQGGEGYAHRLASGVGRQLISETIRFGVAAADGEDPRYHRSQESGVWNRARHAIVETFTSETANGNRIPAYSRFAGTYGAAFISNAWYPDSRATPGWALRRGSTALASSVGFHLFEEFMPRKYFKALGISDGTQPQP